MSWNFSWPAVIVLATLAAAPSGARHGLEAKPARLPPVASRQADPADSVYRAARTALTRREYRKAAQLFAAIETRFAGSQYAADARYWEAFALYRLGSDDGLRQALAALNAQRRRHPTAATRGDAAALERREIGRASCRERV